MFAAIAISVAGAVLYGLGPLVGLVSISSAAAFPSWPLLLLLGLLAPGIAAWCRHRGRPVAAVAALTGPAALAPGRILLDLQLLIDPGVAARPELLRLTTLDPVSPGIGAWLLVVGHLAAIAAAAVAFHGLAVGTGGEAGTSRQGLLSTALCGGTLAAVGVLMAPFSSTDPYLLARSAVDSPGLVMAGSLLVAAAAPTAAGVLVGASDPEYTRGGLLGLAAAIAGVVGPPLVSVAALEQIHFSWGPLLGLLGALLLVALAFAPERTGRERPADVALPALARLRAAAGALALAAGVCGLLAALLPQLEVPLWLRDPTTYPARMFWPAAAVQLLVGAGMLVPRLAERLRPVLAVGWSAVPLAAAGVLDSALMAIQSVGAGVRAGMWFGGAAVLLAVLAGLVATVAGWVERDEVDLTELDADRRAGWLAAIASPLAALAFALPVLSAPDFSPPALTHTFTTASWGLLLALAVVVGAVVLAPRCRRGPAVALLVGAAAVVAVRGAEFPLTAGRVDGPEPGPGLWAAVLCLVVLLAGALVVSWRGRAG